MNPVIPKLYGLLIEIHTGGYLVLDRFSHLLQILRATDVVALMTDFAMTRTLPQLVLSKIPESHPKIKLLLTCVVQSSL